MATSGRDRIAAVFVGSLVGGVVSLVTLKVLNDWAFRTEFSFYVRLTAVHSCLAFILFAFWFGVIRPKIPRTNTMLHCIGAAAVAGVLPVLIPWGFVLVMTGQAFITSGVAALVYAGISALQDR